MAAKLSLTLVDAYGRTTKRIIGMEDQALLADYETAAAALLTDLAAVSDLGVVKADLIINVSGAEQTDPVAGANVDVGGTFSGWIALGDGKKASLKVPGIKPALVSADGTIPIVDDVADYLANWETTGDFNLSDGEQIDSWIRGALDK
jgi:hypothetical protein